MIVKFNINIDDKIVKFIKPLFSKKGLIISSALVFITGFIITISAQSNVWDDFVAGEPISASKMNSKFNSLKEAMVPTGTIMPFAGSLEDEDKIPEGWLLCNGQSYDPSAKPELFAVIQYLWGQDGNYFRVPDLRGAFLRGLDTKGGVDPDSGERTDITGDVVLGNRVGSYQDDAMQRIVGNISSVANKRWPGFSSSGALSMSGSIKDEFLASTSGSYNGYTSMLFDNAAIDISTNKAKYKTSGDGSGNGETRPKNAAVYYIIKE